MPSLKVHCALSKKRTGRSFEDLHRWMDLYHEELGAEHRSKRHFWSKEQEQKIRDYYDKKEIGLGRVAVEEWLFHIALDNLDTLYKKVQRNRPMEDKVNVLTFGFLNSGFIYYEGLMFKEKDMKPFFEYLRTGGKKE